MSKFYTSKNNNYGKEIDYAKVTNLFNSLISAKGYGVLLDCVVPQIRNVDYPHGISKPIPFLRAVNLEDKLMLVMVEYKLYVPGAENDQELALEINKDDFKVFKKEDEINFLYHDDKVIEIKLHNSFDFSYDLDDEEVLPTLLFIDWVSSPFI